jgi:hypothetical protein
MIRRLRAMLKGELSTGGLESRRAAGATAYSIVDEPAAKEVPLFGVCAWNAFAFQTIADKLVEADAAADPATAGYVPRSTLGYMSECLDLVQHWLRQARIVQSDPNARVAGALPARLPVWHRDEPTRLSELQGLRAAYDALEARVETELAEASPPELHRCDAEMRSAAEYAAALASRRAGPVDRGEARASLLEAIQHALTLGQLLALPTLGEIEILRRDRAAGLPTGRSASWLAIAAGWPVLDCDGAMVGLVLRTRGDRATGRFDGVDVSRSGGSPDLRVPGDAVDLIESGQIRLSVAKTSLS